jgi:hypothetical protein
MNCASNTAYKLRLFVRRYLIVLSTNCPTLLLNETLQLR